MSEKEGAGSDEGSVPLTEIVSGSNKKSASKKKNTEKSSKKDSTTAEVPEESSSKENENDKTKPRRKKNYYVEVEENEKIAVPLLDQPTVVEGSRQRKKVIPENNKPELKLGSIPIPDGKGVALGRIPTITHRFKRLRLDEIKTLHRFMFGKLGDVTYLNNNILSFNGFAFTKDSTEYARKLVVLGKMKMSVLREFLLLFDLDLKIRKKEDVIKAILEFLLCPQRAETTVNPNIVSHPKRRATKRNYYEREIENEEKKSKKAKQNKVKDNEAAKETGESSGDKGATKKHEEEKKKKDEESKENNSGADNTNELKKPAKKRKRNQVIEEPTESTDDGRSKKNKDKEANNDSAIDNEDDEVNTTENLSDDELKIFLKKVLADANLEKTTMKTVYSLISKHYPNYNFSKKKDFIKEVVKSAIQT